MIIACFFVCENKNKMCIRDRMPAVLAFPLVFVIGAVLSSLTGSAWGTYAVVMPLGILLAQAMDLSVFAGIGVAVSGGVYGDISAKNSHAMHYSAESAGVDPEEFRRTQQPYMPVSYTHLSF